jgi:hypothetical protein
MNTIQTLLHTLNGVIQAELLSVHVRQQIDELESGYEKTAFLPISNLGIRIVLSRNEVWVILKDTSFRPPPRPTVYMVEEWEQGKMPEEQILSCEGKNYHILGEEVLPGSTDVADDARPIGDGFVFYPQRRKDPKIPSYFLIPPIEFRELEEQCDELRIKQVVSVSPSTLTDQHIRSALGFPLDEAYATILIGFDRD